jgi:hypothetical protein
VASEAIRPDVAVGLGLSPLLDQEMRTRLLSLNGRVVFASVLGVLTTVEEVSAESTLTRFSMGSEYNSLYFP